MDIHKLKLDKYSNISLVNFPQKYNLGIESVDDNIEAVLYYIDSAEDVHRFVAFCEAANLPADNRTIMVYEKGRKDGVNRDSIFLPFKEGEYPAYRLKAPMLCSLSDELSACVLYREI